MPSPRQSRLPSPARTLVGVCAVLVIVGVVCVSMYFQRRSAALAYLASAGANDVHTRVPDWWPESIPFPAWLGSVDVAVLNDAPCDLRRLTALSELRQLLCVRCQLDRDGFRRLGALQQLELLQLEGTPVTDDDLVHLRDCPELTHLGLNSTAITDRGLESLAKLHLQQLDVSDTEITNAGLAHLAPLPLQGLRINATSISDAGLALLSALPLTTLSANDTNITGSGLIHLAGMPLEQLSLAGTPVSDAHLAELAACSSLRVLDLSATGVTDAGLTHLATMHLTQLNLAHTPISDAGLRLLQPLPLKSLMVSGTAITADSVTILCGCTALRSLTASDPPFTWESLDPLRSHGTTVSLQTLPHK